MPGRNVLKPLECMLAIKGIMFMYYLKYIAMMTENKMRCT